MINLMTRFSIGFHRRLGVPFLAASLLASAPLLPAQDKDGASEEKANPYEAIVERNPFALKPPPPPPDPDAAPPAPAAPLATVEVTGVTSIFSKKKALVEIVPGPGKPPMKLTLNEGERVDAIEIVAIDVEKAEVTINNAGTVTNISLKVAKAPTGAPAATPAIPGMPVAPGLIPPPAVPGVIPTPPQAAFTSSGRAGSIVAGGNAPVLGGGGGMGSVPQVMPNFGQPGVGAQPGGIYTSAGGNPGALINRPIRTQTPIPSEAPQQAADPAVQYINMAVQKQTLESRGVRMPPLPPVPGLDQ
ncbi:MAG: hypothetical protein RJA22_1619 [Verrucomicrobiota bacterium]|jgi:hypothetical protein